MTQPAEIASQIRRQGYAFIPAYQPDQNTDAVASSVGAPCSSLPDVSAHRLMPTTTDDAPPNTYSGIHGLGEFPLHTDFAHWRDPPRYIMLRCVVGDPDVHTMLVDGHDLIRSIGETVLRRALVRPRRPVSGKLPLLVLLGDVEHHRRMRWDEVFIKPASQAGIVGVQAMRDALDAAQPRSVSLAEQGDTLVVDNWRMLHGRTPVASTTSRRIIERTYLGGINEVATEGRQNA